MTVAFHFVLLAVGEVLKVDNYITPQSLQNFIANEESFGGHRIPLDECRLALQMLESSGFIKEENPENYKWRKH